MLMIQSLLILVDFVWNVNRVVPETSFFQHFSGVLGLRNSVGDGPGRLLTERIRTSGGGPGEKGSSNQRVKPLGLFLFGHHSAIVKNFQPGFGIQLL